MNSQEMVQMYDAKLEGQQLLFPDDDIILRNTPFKSIDPEFDKQALIHWWMHVYLPERRSRDENTPFPVYQSWSNALYNYFTYTGISGYNPATNQQAIRFSGYMKESGEEQTEELRLWLPHIKPCLNKYSKREGKRIGIFEHRWSEGGVWGLWIYNEDPYDIALDRLYYSRNEERAKFDSLGKAVWFVCSHLWYEKKLRR